MRTRHALFWLCVAGCSDDEGRTRVEITKDPATAMDDASAGLQAGDGGDAGRGGPLGGGNVSRPRGMDASTGELDAQVESSTVDSAAPSPYACQTNNDCAILNVGSCCGYFPRCANANAVFTAPDCSDGVVSNCGFPTIDSCRCELGQCVSLQAGVAINYP